MFDEEQVAHRLRHIYPEGPSKYSSALGATRELLTVTVERMAAEFKRIGANIYLALEKDSRGIDPRGLIICAANRTQIIPLVVSPSLVRIHEQPIFVGYPEGAPNLMKALLAEVEAVVESAQEGGT